MVGLAGLGIAFACALPLREAAGAGTRPAVVSGFTIEVVAHVPQARELVATPNGDLLAGTLGSDVYVIPNAEGEPGTPAIFARIDDRDAAGIALGAHALYVGTTFGIWRMPYATGDRRARSAPERIATVRAAYAGAHSTTSLAVTNDTLYAGIGSSCNACEETDATRATIQQMTLDGKDERPRAVHLRNAIALAIDPATNALWAGSAGQDELAHGHPYEIFDDVAAIDGVADYGWPSCVEDRRPAHAGADCSHVTEARAAFPAYETPIGAAFYPADAHGPYAFPAAWRGGAFVSLHGSWHKPLVAPLVAFVPITGAAPAIPIDWNDPAKQWKTFVTGWQRDGGVRIGRPTGVAVGPSGSLFVADDQTGSIYRVRPIVK